MNGRSHSLANVAAAGDDKLVSTKVSGSHGAARVEFIRTDTNFRPKAVFVSICPAGGGIDHDTG